MLPWQWLAALLAPALGLGLRSADGGLDWPRLLVYLPAQAACAWFALVETGPLALPAALTAMLLPPLAFTIGRRGEADALLATFLGFCLLLVGTILGGASPALTILFALGAALQLRCHARLQLLGSVPAATNTTAPLRVTLGGLAMAGSSTVLAMALLQAFDAVPAFAKPLDPSQAQRARERQVGLNDRFDLEGGGGFGDLRRVELVRVTNADPEALPEDMYLRTTFFDVPGLGSWSTSAFEPEVRDTVGRSLSIRPRVAQVPTLRTTIERRDAARAYVFAPTGTLSLRGLRGLRADLPREWFRQQSDAPALVYEVQSQDLRWVLGELEADERWAPALTRLPDGLDMQMFGRLLQEWAPRTASAEETAAAIAAGLRRQCAYSLEEPTGPYRQPLHDFLAGNRRGWCMHFASAAALMLRMKGIPCRIAVGLYGGDREESRPDVRTYGSQHAHAWVEIPFRGLGWVVFDPTPPDHRGRRGVDEAAETAGGDAATPEQPAASILRLPDAPWLPLVLLAGLLAVIFVPGSLHRRRESATERAMRPVRKELVRLMAELARRGHPRSTRATLEDYAAWLRVRGIADPELHAAFHAYQDVRFGGREFDETRRSVFVRAREAARRLPAPETVSGS
ncbi:MAG: hypothetical protein RIT25_1012 [Planctomycetota bacterium]